MDRFELNWPGADASFYTDGWRCRIVWRQKDRRGGGGMGGTIDNNRQCVKRAAESLEGAPYLLSALKARGHIRLADQIEICAAQAPEQVAQEVPKIADGKEWLKQLQGEGAFETASSKRAKAWLALGELGGEALLLKAPAASGKAEWVLKRTWPEDPKRTPEYVVAGSFKGIAGYLLEAGATATDIERILAALADVAHPELGAAARAWRSTASTH